ncbi:hypothetical protein BD410DRAFT_308218 [Rickenella mellea]|uniref:Uncharacterized protein n=1 Tax=Rickenella mellea TaxID=50990 RepID=A0A4Y7Q1B8_9AGAM|nr:hypothetical protein BD410DRAFT_308218 [Rickenella mellea]
MEGLDDLLSLLTRVKKVGWDDAFANNLCQNNSKLETRHPTYSEHLPIFLHAIEEARVYMKALNEAQRRVGKRLHRLRRRIRPLVLEDGIKRLPDDVLAIIFEITRQFSGDSPGQISVCLSHVSRRFRHVALATPSLWTTIHDSYWGSQIREFISRSGCLDLDVKMHNGLCTGWFLNVLQDTSHRWSSFDIIEDVTEGLMMELGITNLPRLRHLTYTCAVELSTFSLPRLSQVDGWGWGLPAESYLLSNLTHVEFRLSEEDQDIVDLATTLQNMKNLQDLSFLLEDCTQGTILLSDDEAYPGPEVHSVHIDRLAISIQGEMKGYSALLFDALMYLRPSTFELSIYSPRPHRYLFNSHGFFFPYGSTITLRVPQSFDVMWTLADILRTCDILKTVHFDKVGGPLEWHSRPLDDGDWECLRSLDHLRFTNCDKFSESEIEALATRLFQTPPEIDLQSLEITSCKMISEDFLLGLQDEVGDRLKWSL